MNKVNGKKSSFAPVRNDGTRITICYGLKQLNGDLYEWREVYLPKKQTNSLTLADIKSAIIGDIDERTKTAIIGGFKWQEKPVWLSIENQLNFSQATAPVTLKIGEQEDGTPVYHTFETQQDIGDFCTACTQWTQQQRESGWQEKDGIDWASYEALFPTEE